MTNGSKNLVTPAKPGAHGSSDAAVAVEPAFAGMTSTVVGRAIPLVTPTTNSPNS
jgi:hypothetical protein